MGNIRKAQIRVWALVFMSLLVLMSALEKTAYAQSGGYLNLDGDRDKAEAATIIFPDSSTLRSLRVEADGFGTMQGDIDIDFDGNTDVSIIGKLVITKATTNNALEW